jgi:hypothetical protein
VTEDPLPNVVCHIGPGGRVPVVTTTRIGQFYS